MVNFFLSVFSIYNSYLNRIKNILVIKLIIVYYFMYSFGNHIRIQLNELLAFRRYANESRYIIFHHCQSNRLFCLNGRPKCDTDAKNWNRSERRKIIFMFIHSEMKMHFLLQASAEQDLLNGLCFQLTQKKERKKSRSGKNA